MDVTGLKRGADRQACVPSGDYRGEPGSWPVLVLEATMFPFSILKASNPGLKGESFAHCPPSALRFHCLIPLSNLTRTLPLPALVLPLFISRRHARIYRVGPVKCKLQEGETLSALCPMIALACGPAPGSVGSERTSEDTQHPPPPRPPPPACRLWNPGRPLSLWLLICQVRPEAGCCKEK